MTLADSDRSDVWLVRYDGSDVDVTVRDAVERLCVEGLPWLDRLAKTAEAIRCLLEEPDAWGPGFFHELYGMHAGGGIGSPARQVPLACLAAAAGDWRLVRTSVEEMSKLAYFSDNPTDLESLREELRALTGGGHVTGPGTIA